MLNKIFLFLIVFSLLFGLQGKAQSADDGDIQDTVTHASTKKVESVGNKICPVSGEKVGEGGMEPVRYEYEGKIYNLCCTACIEEFKNNPKKYIKIIEAQVQTEKSSEAQAKETPVGGSHSH